ncbi:hypothetical protein MMG85_11875 [Pseudoxanthomonas sp. LH2527]|uniref:hypothetical protein n=1 Tax=Pseudoxanthomonas sp. LH2527 TaxID=2923249 RepID=UPI001F13F1B0|nr:hypothetical protein [Pseudoxanthomonas sp. LH2527]MCH6484256.1 hypothetical protein [Pseudoxanthomonas sp. LH2527]
MSVANEVTAKQLAHILGVAPSYITQLKGEGRLVRSADGKRFLLAESRKLLGETADPSKAGVAARHAAARGAAVALEAASAPSEPDDAEAPLAPAQDDPLAKRRALAQAQAEEAKARKLLRDEAVELGQLLPVDEVRSAIADAVTAMRADLDNLPAILAPQLAAEQDEDRVRVILRDAIEHIEREFARKATAIAKEEAR